MSDESPAFLEDLSPERFMAEALKEARRAREAEEVPVGAVIVDVESGRVVARAHNQRELLKDPTAHAEILAITQAADYYKSWRLTDCVLYVTLEPCLMCAGAIVQARIPEVVYGAVDPKAGAHCSVFEVLANSSNNHFPRVQGGVLRMRALSCSGDSSGRDAVGAEFGANPAQPTGPPGDFPLPRAVKGSLVFFLFFQPFLTTSLAVSHNSR